MNKVKRLTVALLVLVIGLFASMALVACGEEEETINISVADVSGTFTYNGAEQTPDLEVKNNSTVLTIDYSKLMSLLWWLENSNSVSGEVQEFSAHTHAIYNLLPFG